MLENPLKQNVGGIVELNGNPIPWISIEINNNNYNMADTFTVVVSIFEKSAYNFAFWANLDPTNTDLTIYMGYPIIPEIFTTAELSLLFTGKIDNIEFSPIEGTVTLTGRDLSSLFIDTPLNKTYSNQTASGIATTLAQAHGLNAVVSPTTIPVGNYSNGYTSLVPNKTEWDYLVSLANQIGYIVYVQEKTLFFISQPSPTDPDAHVVDINYPINQTVLLSNNTNVENITFGRDLTLSKTLEVKIQSFSQLSGKSFTQVAKKIGMGTASDIKQFIRSKPNLSPASAQKLSNSLLKNIAQHEITIAVTMVPDVIMTKNSILKVNDTNSPFDQYYYIDRLTRELSAQNGFTMLITGKNKVDV